jgi:hypothetical protein
VNPGSRERSPDELAEQDGSVKARLDDLADRLRELDLRARIAANPWPAVGAAALCGVWLGFAPLRGRRRRRSATRSRLGDLVLATLGAITLRLAREAAFRQMGVLAKRWWEQSSAPPRHTDVTYDAPYGEH